MCGRVVYAFFDQAITDYELAVAEQAMAGLRNAQDTADSADDGDEPDGGPTP